MSSKKKFSWQERNDVSPEERERIIEEARIKVDKWQDKIDEEDRRLDEEDRELKAKNKTSTDGEYTSLIVFLVCIALILLTVFLVSNGLAYKKANQESYIEMRDREEMERNQKKRLIKEAIKEALDE